MRDYFKNGEKINFIFPIDGDCVNENDGKIVDGALYITAKVAGEADDEVFVNGTHAEYKNGAFEAEVKIGGWYNTIAAESKKGGKAKVAVLKLDNAVGGWRLSVDDNIIFLWDINKNKDVYKSIFENPYLAVYKRAHDLYGMKLHLNLFYEFDEMDDFKEDRGHFNLSMMTDKFKDEWIANSHWLRLSFHAKANHPDMPYKNTTRDEIGPICQKVQNEIIRFAGRETLSDVTTVHWGECTLEGMRELRSQGIKGFAGYFELNPDGSTLVSYHYPPEFVEYLTNRDFWRDNEENFICGRIDLVLNCFKLEQIVPLLDEIYENKTRSGFMELMIHEEYFYPDYDNYIPEFEEIVLTASKWCYEHGYEGRTFGSVMFEKRNTIN